MTPSIDYVVAVPSHARASTINRQTLRTLAEGGIPAERVTVFVAEAERYEYQRALDPALYGDLALGGDDLAAQRNAVTRHFNSGDPVVSIDDDIDAVMERIDEKSLRAMANLDEFVRSNFSALQDAGLGLWGVYPVCNAYFMKPRRRVGLHFCIGQLFGVFNSRDEYARTTISQKEDYERTLRWFRQYGAVMRCDFAACKSRMFAPGGMQAPDQPSRNEINESAVRYLLDAFPAHVRVKARPNPRVGREIRLVQ
jgi:hypothetical protein